MRMLARPPVGIWWRCAGAGSAAANVRACSSLTSASPSGLKTVKDAPSFVMNVEDAQALKNVEEQLSFYEGTIPQNILKTRMDVWIKEQFPNASRGRVTDSIRKGFATVNGRSISKPSFPVEGGDHIVFSLCGADQMEAKPEDIQLDIVYEDEHVLVINKSADMVVHPAPGHSSGTLVNAVLHHCGLPAVQMSPSLMEGSDDEGEELEETEEEEEDDEKEEENADEANSLQLFRGPNLGIRPGIVHRLDKGTTGLLVVAKTEQAQFNLSDQFKTRKARRTYLSITCGTPPNPSGRIEAGIIRDPRDRKRMTTADTVIDSRRARYAASRYKVIHVLAKGGASLVEWKLETGRTHQIRVHARYMGYPVLGDDVYGGTQALATARLVSSLKAQSPSARQSIHKCIEDFDRPALHAYSLGFVHPATQKRVHFRCPPPQDFEELWKQLRTLKPEK